MHIVPRAAYQREKLETICRTDGCGTYYFFYNGGDAMETEVILSGTGAPVELNAWTGETTPVSYEKTEQGSKVSLTLAHRDAAILALLPETADVPRRRYGAMMNIDRLDTTIISWGPDPDAPVPTQSKKTALALGLQTVGPWDTLNISNTQLNELGVDSMAHVSGQGVYRTAFTLPECDGAVLGVETGDCMVVAGTINGKPLPPLNQRSGKVDLTGLVQAGENTLELTIATTLINRLKIEHPLFDGKGGMPAPPAPGEATGDEAPAMGNLPDEDYELPTAPMDMPAPRAAECRYGIYSVTVTPYRNL